MKQETKQRLKHYSKIGQYIVISLCWLMALIGVSAYSVYWLLQNASYVQECTEVASHNLVPKRAEEDNYFGYYQTREASYYSDYKNIDEIKGIVFSGNYVGSTYVSILCDFYYFDNSNVAIRDGFWMDVYFNRRVTDGANEFNIDRVLIYYNQPTNDIYYIVAGGVNSGYLTLTGRPTFRTPGVNITAVDVYKFFDYLFAPIYSSDNSIRFEFTEDYNFGRLTSEVVTSERLIVPYNNSYNGDPSDENIYFYSRFNFVSNGQLYRGICYVLSKPIYIYRNSLQNVNFVGSLSQLQVKQVLYMRTLPSSINELYNWLALSTNYDVVSNKHILRYENYNDGQRDIMVAVYDYKQYDWVNQSYRLLSINAENYNSQYEYACYPNDNTMWNSRLYTGLTLYQVLNNGYMDYNYYTNVYDDSSNNLGMAFTLLGSAFAGLTSLMAIQVLPNITLGMLFLVPLIVTIILVVLKLVKK